MDDLMVKEEVRQFYDQIGWQTVGEGLYQNARYEDLRPVSREYVHRCHLRVKRFLPPTGRFLLDAGSGPIQYPEYLTYSEGYTYRVCADLSIVALKEARKRIGDHGLFVVADVAHLPFKPGVFQGLVSLHTLHHLPAQDHVDTYDEFIRVLMPGGTAAVVNGWTNSLFMDWAWKPVRLVQAVVNALGKLGGNHGAQPEKPKRQKKAAKPAPTGTFILRFDLALLEQTLEGKVPYEIRPWRSVSVQWLRAAVHPRLGGRFWLRVLYALENRFPHFFGENGQYPLILLHKPEAS